MGKYKLFPYSSSGRYGSITSFNLVNWRHKTSQFIVWLFDRFLSKSTTHLTLVNIDFAVEVGLPSLDHILPRSTLLLTIQSSWSVMVRYRTFDELRCSCVESSEIFSIHVDPVHSLAFSTNPGCFKWFIKWHHHASCDAGIFSPQSSFCHQPQLVFQNTVLLWRQYRPKGNFENKL